MTVPPHPEAYNGDRIIRNMGSRPAPITISDGEEELMTSIVAVPGGTQQKLMLVAEEEAKGSEGDRLPWPKDLPEDFKIEGYYVQNEKFKITGYICPVSNLKFNLLSEALDYCFSRGVKHAIREKEMLSDKNTLQGKPMPVAEVETKGSGDDEIPWPQDLPDGFKLEGYYLRDGKFKITSYICPVSELKFNLLSVVLDYCFSGGIERAIAAKETLNDKNTLQGKYAWLIEKPGWVLEIRAGGKNFNKMFKFYAHPSLGVRLQSKNEVKHFIKEAKLPKSVNGDCDTSIKDNIIAQLELRINSLPLGWVKETAFKKCSDGIKKDVFYTDPITQKLFRSLKSAKQYFITGEALGAHYPIMGVTDMYSFDRCTKMLPCLATRLKMEEIGGQKHEGTCPTSFQEENGKRALHGDVKEEQDEEDCHGHEGKKQDKAHKPYVNVEEEADEEVTLSRNNEDEEDKQEARHGDGRDEDNSEGMILGDGKKNYEMKMDKFRSIIEIYQVTTPSAEYSLKGEKE